MTLVAFVPCLTHDLHSAVVLDGGAGAFGATGATVGAARAEAAAWVQTRRCRPVGV